MPRPAPVHKTCEICSAAFQVPRAREHTAKYCSRACSDAKPQHHATARCKECGIEFKRKASHAARNNAFGNFCGIPCLSAAKKRLYRGDANPNSNGRNMSHDGYRLFSPAASLGLGLGKIKMHHAVAFQSFGITKLPAGLHVHHRDCDVLNNEPGNLQVMTSSDHKWLHHQYGVATLRAIMQGKIDIQDASLWSDDPLKAFGLLIADVTSQAVSYRYWLQKHGSVDLGAVASARPVRANFIEVDELSDTARGAGGMGSTGE